MDLGLAVTRSVAVHEKNDLYKSTFGEPPELKCMMNSQKIADEILMARL